MTRHAWPDLLAPVGQPLTAPIVNPAMNRARKTSPLKA
jgi:hypothetical protein